MPDLPTGTVTFLFTDIEGSTRRWEEQREAMSAALERHNAILLEAIQDNYSADQAAFVSLSPGGGTGARIQSRVGDWGDPEMMAWVKAAGSPSRIALSMSSNS